jgi:hypothetical protein
MAENGSGKFRRVDIGFQAGPVLSLRLQEPDYKSLHEALGGPERWHEVASEEATVTLDLAQVIYVRLDTESGRVGF